MDDLQSLVRFFKALGDGTRLDLVRLLTWRQDSSAMCVTRLANELGVSPSSVSQHLRVLKDLGLVQSERRGLRIHYWLHAEGLDRYRQAARAQLGGAFADLLSTKQTTKEADMSGCGCSGGCEHPDRLQGAPGECSDEQIRECHGDAEGHPCVSDEGCGCGCEHPDQAQGAPSECSAEQIRKCHGDVEEHPCEAN